jgi:hypothetical protein
MFSVYRIGIRCALGTGLPTKLVISGKSAKAPRQNS